MRIVFFSPFLESWAKQALRPRRAGLGAGLGARVRFRCLPYFYLLRAQRLRFDMDAKIVFFFSLFGSQRSGAASSGGLGAQASLSLRQAPSRRPAARAETCPFQQRAGYLFQLPGFIAAARPRARRVGGVAAGKRTPAGRAARGARSAACGMEAPGAAPSAAPGGGEAEAERAAPRDAESGGGGAGGGAGGGGTGGATPSGGGTTGGGDGAPAAGDKSSGKRALEAGTQDAGGKRTELEVSHSAAPFANPWLFSNSKQDLAPPQLRQDPVARQLFFRAPLAPLAQASQARASHAQASHAQASHAQASHAQASQAQASQAQASQATQATQASQASQATQQSPQSRTLQASQQPQQSQLEKQTWPGASWTPLRRTGSSRLATEQVARPIEAVAPEQLSAAPPKINGEQEQEQEQDPAAQHELDELVEFESRAELALNKTQAEQLNDTSAVAAASRAALAALPPDFESHEERIVRDLYANVLQSMRTTAVSAAEAEFEELVRNLTTSRALAKHANMLIQAAVDRKAYFSSRVGKIRAIVLGSTGAGAAEGVGADVEGPGEDSDPPARGESDPY
jgi:hypothetical protein